MVLWNAININGDRFTIAQDRNMATIEIYSNTLKSILSPVHYTSISDLKEILNAVIGEYAPLNNDYRVH